LDAFNAVLAEMVVQKGHIHGGKYKCHHHIVNRVHMGEAKTAEDGATRLMDCGCTEEKAVAEWCLKKRETIGRVYDDRDLWTLSQTEWYKLDHVMGNLFGYSTNWLLDKEAMKTGLKEALRKLE
jgi:hypothetical protein